MIGHKDREGPLRDMMPRERKSVEPLAAVTAVLERAADGDAGLDEPSGGCEDFSLFLNEVPGLYFRLGIRAARPGPYQGRAKLQSELLHRREGTGARSPRRLVQQADHPFRRIIANHILGPPAGKSAAKAPLTSPWTNSTDSTIQSSTNAS